MLLRGRTFALRPSVKVGGGAIGAMPMSLPVGSGGVSRVPLLPVPLGIGVRARFRLVPREGIVFAGVGGQAGGKRAVRTSQPMPTPVSPARSWACCIASSTLRPTRRSTGRRSALRLRHTVAPAPVTLSLGPVRPPYIAEVEPWLTVFIHSHMPVTLKKSGIPIIQTRWLSTSQPMRESIA